MQQSKQQLGLFPYNNASPLFSIQGEWDETKLNAPCQKIQEIVFQNSGMGAASAPRAVNYLTQVVYALIEANYRGHHAYGLKEIARFFHDTGFRHSVISYTTNETIKATYDPQVGKYEMLSERQQMEHVMPVLRGLYPIENQLGLADKYEQEGY